MPWGWRRTQPQTCLPHAREYAHLPWPAPHDRGRAPSRVTLGGPVPTLPDVDLLLVATLVLTVLVAAVVQGATGFGFALLAVPLFALVLPAREAVVVGVVLSLVISVGQVAPARRDVDLVVFRRLLIASVAGMPLGLVLFLAAPTWVLQFGVGVVVLASAALPHPMRWARPGRVTDLVSGLVSGLLKTSVAINGPPLVFALRSHSLDPARFRATMAAVLAGGNAAATAFFAVSGSITTTVAVAALVAAPLVLVGQHLGTRLGRLGSPRVFSFAVTTLVLLSGVVCLARGLYAAFA